MVGVSASLNLPLHHEVQKFSSGTGSPGCSQKKGRKTVVVLCVVLCRPKSGAWEATKGLPDAVQVKTVRTAEEKDSVLSLVSSGEVDHQQSSFLFNKVAFQLMATVYHAHSLKCFDAVHWLTENPAFEKLCMVQLMPVQPRRLLLH